jgi:hypothetical protein
MAVQAELKVVSVSLTTTTVVEILMAVFMVAVLVVLALLTMAVEMVVAVQSASFGDQTVLILQQTLQTLR